MARIKHIAIRTGDVEKTAAFYKEAFGLKQVGLGQNGIYLTDGHLNIAVLKFQPGKTASLCGSASITSVSKWMTSKPPSPESTASAANR